MIIKKRTYNYTIIYCYELIIVVARERFLIAAKNIHSNRLFNRVKSAVLVINT